MDVAGLGAIIGVGLATAVVMPMMIGKQKKKLAGIEALLRERGGMTLDEICKELKTGVIGRGYLMQALDQMVKEGKLTRIAPPKGHPRLRIVRDTKYQAAA
jgi:hypothetical protein